MARGRTNVIGLSLHDIAVPYLPAVAAKQHATCRVGQHVADDTEAARSTGRLTEGLATVSGVSASFAEILQGLMDNRRLSGRALSRASGRAESTIRQLLAGRLEPTAGVLQDIAPALEMTVADLLVIAGLPVDYDVERPGPWLATQKIGSLVAAATWLTPAQVEQLTALARQLSGQAGEGPSPSPAAPG